MCSEMNNTANHLLTSSCIFILYIYLYIDTGNLVTSYEWSVMLFVMDYNTVRTGIRRELLYIIITVTVSVACEEWTKHQDFNFKFSSDCPVTFSLNILLKRVLQPCRFKLTLKIFYLIKYICGNLV